MTDTHRDTQPVTAIHRKQYLACVLLALLALSPMLVLPWLNTSVAVNGADELDAWPQQAAALGLVLQNQTEGGQGLYVLAVMENSAAQHMGLEAGDLLLSLDGVALSSCDELDALLAASPASARLEFSLLRDSQQVTLSFVPQEGV